MTNARAPRGRRGFEALIKKMRDTGITRADILRFGIACALHTPDPDLAFVPLALIFEFPNQNQHARLDFVAQLYDKFVIIYHETRQAADRREDYENVVAAARAGGRGHVSCIIASLMSRYINSSVSVFLLARNLSSALIKSRTAKSCSTPSISAIAAAASVRNLLRSVSGLSHSRSRQPSSMTQSGA